MADHKYAFQGYNEELHVRAVGRSLPISTKVSVEISNFLRKRSLQDAKRILERVVNEEQAIPYRRFNKDIGHKPGKIGPERYPKKASTEFINVMKNVEANAQMKGFNTNNLQIIHLCAHKASRPWHYGRQRRLLMKRTHVEIVVQEAAVKAKGAKKSEVKETKPEEKKEMKIEAKSVEKKVEVKKEEPKPEKKVEEKVKPVIKTEVKAEKVEEKKLSEGKQDVAKTSMAEPKPNVEEKKVEEKPKEEPKLKKEEKKSE